MPQANLGNEEKRKSGATPYRGKETTSGVVARALVGGRRR